MTQVFYHQMRQAAINTPNLEVQVTLYKKLFYEASKICNRGYWLLKGFVTYNEETMFLEI